MKDMHGARAPPDPMAKAWGLRRLFGQSIFQRQDFSVFVPGNAVLIKGYPVDLRMVLILVGTSDPYKVFYRRTQDAIEIFMVRHLGKDHF